MTGGDPEPLRIALLNHDRSAGSATARHVRELTEALRRAGHRPRALSPRPSRPAQALLRRRGFVESLGQVPVSLLSLGEGDFDVAHAFTTSDALAGVAWRRVSGRPVVFTCVEPLRREGLADRRLRLWLLERAVRDTDAVTAATSESRAALARWLAIDAPVLAADDAAAHTRVYRELLARRG